MSKTNCDHAALTAHANLQSANLEGANIEYAYLDRAKLQYVDLANMSAKHTTIKCADLRDAVLARANLYFQLLVSPDEVISRSDF